MRTAIEEAKSLRFMLRCLGIPLAGPAMLYGANLGVIQNAQMPEADLKKKHVALSYHVVREAVASGVCAPMWMDTHSNHADILTKQNGQGRTRRQRIAGLDVARINASHSDHAGIRRQVSRVRRVSHKVGMPVAVAWEKMSDMVSIPRFKLVK